jgi:hypothetical protein
MEATKHNAKLILALVILASHMAVVQAADEQSVQWNESAKSVVLNRDELHKLRDALPTWKIKQMAWPSSEELISAVTAVDGKLKDDCVSWIAKFIDNNQLPKDLRVHLVAMKEWGLIRKQSEQKRLCDVFITRFRKGPYTIHLQESPANVVVVIGHENLLLTDDIDHKSLIFETAYLFLKEELRPEPKSKRLHVYKETHEKNEITRVTWQIESALIEDEKGNTLLDLSKAAKVGTWHVEAETNGKYVRFNIEKETEDPVSPDPYVERFRPTK